MTFVRVGTSFTQFMLRLCNISHDSDSLVIKSFQVSTWENLRGSLGSIRVLELLLLGSPGGDVAHHLFLIAGLVLSGQVLKFPLLLKRHRLKKQTNRNSLIIPSVSTPFVHKPLGYFSRVS